MGDEPVAVQDSQALIRAMKQQGWTQEEVMAVGFQVSKYAWVNAGQSMPEDTGRKRGRPCDEEKRQAVVDAW